MEEEYSREFSGDNPVPPPAFVLNGKFYLCECPVHQRVFTYVEFQQQKCHWCFPELASPFLIDGKTKNPCYNSEHGRPYTKEEIESILAESRRFRKKSNG